MYINNFRVYPSQVVWEITFACNMRCLHCGTSAGKKRPDELNTQEALNLIDELAGLGSEHITLSGGEPLMREDWRTMARHVKEKGMKAYIISNGLAVTEEIVDDFADIGFGDIGISFDGTEKTHNYIRQRDDSFAKAYNALNLMAKKGIPKFCAVTQVSNINLNELGQIRQLLIDAGCNLWRIQLATSTGRMKELKDLILSLENYPIMIDKILEFKADGGPDIDVGENIGYYGCKGSELLDGLPYFGCYAGTRVVGIESNGNIKGCLSMQEEFVEGNIRDSSFTEIWNRPGAFAYNRNFRKETADGECRECKYLPLCRGGCTTTSMSATGKRADNPYCMYRMEQKQGIACKDSEMITHLLSRFENLAVPEQHSER
jgi:radical SAM protein with 4Fe4S-binding SPASM domain